MPVIVRGLELFLLLLSAPKHAAKRIIELADLHRKYRDGGISGLA